MKRKIGFTLAETLTVLTILGVISAILIPILNVNVEKQKIETALSKFYSSFSVNIQTILNEKNCNSISCLRVYPLGLVRYGQHEQMYDNVDENGNIFADENGDLQHKGFAQDMGHVFANPRYFNVASICEDYDCTPPDAAQHQMCNDCLAYDVILPTGTEGQRDDERPKYTIYRLNNASVMALYNFDDNNPATNDNCVPNGRVTVNGTNMGVCGIVLFDANGTKGPNVPGRDLFAFYIVDEPINNSYLVPIGYSGSIVSHIGTMDNAARPDPARAVCAVTRHRQGYNCTARAALDHWKIKYY